MNVSTATADPAAAPSRGWRWFLAVWTVFVVLVVALLWRFGGIGVPEQVFVLHDQGTTREAFWSAARSNLLLAHLSLSRIYPWVLLAPYVFWAASRFNLECEHLRRNLGVQALLAVAFVTGSQWLNKRVVEGQPVRVMVSVSETSATDADAAGAPGGTVTRLRKEIRISGANTSNAPSFAAPLPRGARSGRDGTAGPLTNFHREGGIAWNADFPELPDPDLPVGLFWRGRMLSTGLDLFVFVSLCGLGHAAHFRRRFQERERRAVALESGLARSRLHTLQAQLHPHFLFNTLNSITALVRQNPAAAEEMLTSLSELLRLALSGADRPWSSVREESRFLQLYLDIQQTRFGDRLSFVQDIDPAALDCAIPSLLLQPLVENALRHGIEPTGRPGTVRVCARVCGDVLDLSVEDDGIGCPGLLGGSARQGVGLSNVREQLKVMFDRDATLTFAKGVAGGLAVRIRVPLRTAGNEIEPLRYEDPLPHRG